MQIVNMKTLISFKFVNFVIIWFSLIFHVNNIYKLNCLKKNDQEEKFGSILLVYDILRCLYVDTYVVHT